MDFFKDNSGNYNGTGLTILGGILSGVLMVVFHTAMFLMDKY